jgi:hypothetical protein
MACDSAQSHVTPLKQSHVTLLKQSHSLASPELNTVTKELVSRFHKIFCESKIRYPSTVYENSGIESWINHPEFRLRTAYKSQHAFIQNVTSLYKVNKKTFILFVFLLYGNCIVPESLKQSIMFVVTEYTSPCSQELNTGQCAEWDGSRKTCYPIHLKKDSNTFIPSTPWSPTILFIGVSRLKNSMRCSRFSSLKCLSLSLWLT